MVVVLLLQLAVVINALANTAGNGLSARPTRHFINLSNGAEALEILHNANIPPESISFCRIQSSHCEAQDFNGILTNLDHNLLMHLALGYECRVYDFGSRGNLWEGEDAAPVQKYVPRALWWGLEWSRYALAQLWKLEDAESAPPLLRGVNVESMFKSKLDALPKPLNKKLKYYRSHLAPGLTSLDHLKGYYTGTVLDGNKEAYREMLLAHRGRSADFSEPPAPPESFDPPFELYDARTARRVGEMRRPPAPDGSSIQ